MSPPRLLPRDEWIDLAEAHATRADALTADHRARAQRQEAHPVWDFLFTYYSYRPALLRRWHPGVGTILVDAADSPQRQWRWYRETSAGVQVDAAAFVARHAAAVRGIRLLLARTAQREPRFGCFGLHEWAMVYRQGAHRHAAPLRLGSAGTDEVVEAHELRCTHFDAYRFFTPAALPRNASLSRDTQMLTEQPGCLHAGMDLYKWAMKLGPLVPGAVLLDAFELARDTRQLDMEASPYDLTDWGFSPVRIEEPAGKAEYVRRQREFTARAALLRAAMLQLIPAVSPTPVCP